MRLKPATATFAAARAEGPAYPVAQFIEKPPLDVAQQFVASGDYYWNSGMFVFKASRYLVGTARLSRRISSRRPRPHYQAAEDGFGFRAHRQGRIHEVPQRVHRLCRHGEDQGCPGAAARMSGWSDVGSWSSLFDALPADEEGNVLQGDVLVHDTHDCYVHSTSRLVAAVGMDDHIIVETKDAILVAPKDRVQDVKELVAKIKKSGRSESALHREVFRPWGSYDSIDNGERFQVKRLSVKPGGVLSLQMHHHRAEHWIVVQGTARITCNDETFLAVGKRIDLHSQSAPRIASRIPARLPLHIIEVQSGSYLGEDDIVRFEDNYGRKGTST